MQEYYDICAIGFCNAIATFQDTISQLSTYVYKYMEREVLKSMRSNRQEKRKTNQNNIPITEDKNGENFCVGNSQSNQNHFEDYVLTKHTLEGKMQVLSQSEKMVLDNMMLGFSIKEIAEMRECSPQYIHRVKRNIREKLEDIL